VDRRAFIRRTGAVATVALAGCSGSGDDGEASTAPPTSTTEADQSNTVGMVTYRNEFYFDPIGLYVEPGETVTWELDSGEHSTTAYVEGTGTASVTRVPDGASGWNSGTLTEVGATFEHTFETPGTYDYFCIPHKTLEMVGRVVVGEPGGPAEGSMPPDAPVPESQRIVGAGVVGFNEFSEEL